MAAKHELAELAAALRAHCPHDGRFPLRATGVRAVRYSKTSTELIHSTARPVLCIVAQGAKTIFLSPEVFVYDSSRMLILSVDLPVTGQVTAAPYLSLVLDLDPRHVAELALRVYPNGLPRQASPESRGLFLGDANPEILRAGVRLLGLMEQAADAELLAPLVIDEILIRLLRSPGGWRLAQIGLEDSQVTRIAKAVAWLRDNYTQPMRVETLAELAHMSVSTFHARFKAVTTLSPLHYQKALRLQQARRLMLVEMLDASQAAQRVGYLSASQFSREYARYFGSAPTKDIARLLERGLSAADVLR